MRKFSIEFMKSTNSLIFQLNVHHFKLLFFLLFLLDSNKSPSYRSNNNEFKMNGKYPPGFYKYK